MYAGGRVMAGPVPGSLGSLQLCCWHHDCDYDRDYDRDYYDHSDAQLELSGTVASVRDGPGWTWLLATLTSGRWEWVAGAICNPRIDALMS